jgi:hypothetical protein
MLSVSLGLIDSWGAGMPALPTGSLPCAGSGDPWLYATVNGLSCWQNSSPVWLLRLCRPILAVYGHFQCMDILPYLAMDIGQDSLQLSQAAQDQRPGRR